MKYWLKYVKPYWKYFVLSPLFMAVEVIGEVLMPKYLAIVINNAAYHTPMYSAGIMLVMILTALMMMVGGLGGVYFGTKAAVNFAADLRNDVYKKIQQFSFSNIDKFSTGSLVTRLTNDVTQIQNFISMMLKVCLRAPGMMVGALIMTISLRPSLATVFGVAIPVLAICIGIVVFIGLRRFSKMQSRLDALNSTIGENITNVRVVKSFVRRDREVQKFKKANEDLKDAGIGAMNTMITLYPIMTLCMNLTVIAVLWFGGKMVLAEVNPMPIGDLSCFITYCNQILMSLMMITVLFVLASRAFASSKRLKEVLEEKSDIVDGISADENLKITDGDIEFKNVSFKYYKNSSENVLSDINLKIKSGSTVGIIGSTGSGKTTLVSLISRLYSPDEGDIFIDGRSVEDYTIKNLRDGIGMVLQKNVLFSGSIENNLRWGNPDANDEEVVRASRYAQADKFIKDMPEGYETSLEQGGVNVSGGQKQRICIARALLKKPKILILDDSTSAVDTATEAQIRKAFKEELGDCTKIIIAQRISSVQDADEIVVLNEGKIAGLGTHEELLSSCLEYREIYESQTERREA